MDTKPTPSVAYDTWYEHKTPENLGKVITAYLPDIKRNLSIYQGALSPELLEAEGKKLAIGAIRSFDPKHGASLKTHIVNHLQRLNRITATRSHAFRMPEELQRQVKTYQDAHIELHEKLGRDPSLSEVSHHMKWPLKKVVRLRKQFVSEVPEGTQLYESGLDSNAPIDDKIVYVYHDLDPRDQVIFEHLTGFGGKPILKKSEIASKLKISPSIITQRSLHIHKQLKDAMGMT